MKLIRIIVPSIYHSGSLVAGATRAPLPERMALATPDMAVALQRVAVDLAAKGGRLVLSDCFRTREMQQKAHDDWVSKAKVGGHTKAFSPPPGEGLHESGRAVDIDLSQIKITLKEFWDLAKPHGLAPIIKIPNPSASEAWHFECRGSHQLVYDYAKAKQLPMRAYKVMARSAILAAGQLVDGVADQAVGLAQSTLIRLGYDPGMIDGVYGPRSRTAFQKALTGDGPTDERLKPLDERLRSKFAAEFAEFAGPVKIGV